MPEESVNPLLAGLQQTFAAQPCSLVMFGGAGDLARRKLIPGLYNLALDGLLPAHFAAVGFARTDLDDASYRARARAGVERYSRRPLREQEWSDFEKRLHWVGGSFSEAQAYDDLRERLEQIESEFGVPGNRIFYLSIPPGLIETCVERLREAGLVSDPRDRGPFTRVIVEKPIGSDLESARQINRTLAHVFHERQIFRIDHYLGKETVQNVMVMRFANTILEPLWNQKYVDHVQITVAEDEGIGTRANYYEKAGALRDMMQNHILQLLCLTAMEPPYSLTDEVVRDHKLEVLECLRPIAGRDVERYVVRAQYAPGHHRGEQVPGYRREENVRSDSTTETYVALRCHVDNWRWAGVPFYLRTGKRLPRRVSEIAVQWKEVPPILFNHDPEAPLDPNVLVFRIQPDEGLSMRISAKLPGAKLRIFPVKMDFHYGRTFGEQTPEAYERLLLDVMAGDASLFMRRDAVEASWAWVTNVLDAWAESGARYLPEYPAGTWGPVEADRLIQSDGRDWRRP